MAKIMIQGTASSVGKSILVAALCRIFKQDGYKVCPYKSQNMSLNSYITLQGGEMGRAQVLQAYAAGIEPETYMNPILLKPTGDKNCQVIVNGKVYGNATALEYHNMKTKFKDMIIKDFKTLEGEFDIVVIEGAGSPAEINLRENDIVNMGLAEIIDSPVVLVGDIDKGGVFASLAGTMLLLSEDEKQRVKGTIINKFRGDVEILKPGLTMLEDIIKTPTLGVVPYFKLNLEDEDGATEFNIKKQGLIDVAVIKLPRISNFTDVDPLKLEEDITVRFITCEENFGEPDILIIPGSKNTIEDLEILRKANMDKLIKEFALNGGYVLGICGGYQMLGKTIKDPYGVEGEKREVEGLGLLDVDTVFNMTKVTTRVKGHIIRDEESIFEKKDIYGYEIHMGNCTYGENAAPFIKIAKEGTEDLREDGAISKDGKIIGTYVHGIFDSVSFREGIINKLRKDKGLSSKKSLNYEAHREEELDKLAQLVRENIDMEKIYEIMALR